MYKVLLADDKEVFRRKVKRLPYWREASEAFSICFEAQNGREALEYLEREKIDAVLTDIRMPFIDGLELLKIIKERQLCSCVILLSEFAEFEYAKQGIRNGAFDYLVKPVDNEKIQDCFERVFHYLSALKEIPAGSVPDTRIKGIVRAMLETNEKDLTEYGRYLEKEIEKAADPDSERIRMDEILNCIWAELTLQVPYLEQYLGLQKQGDFLKDKDRIPGEDAQKILVGLSKAIEPFLIKTQNNLIRQVCQFLLKHVEEKQSLNEIAECLYVNPKYLGSLFRQEMGCSYKKYVTMLKMNRAKRILETGQDKIFEVAEQLGYDDVDYFSRLFKQETGISPSMYRERGLV